MAKEMGEGRYYADLSERMAQFELTLLDWAEAHKVQENTLHSLTNAGLHSRHSSDLSLAM